MSELTDENWPGETDTVIHPRFWRDMPSELIIPWVIEQHTGKEGRMNQGARKIHEENRHFVVDWGFDKWVNEVAYECFGHDPARNQYWSSYWDKDCPAGGSGGWVAGFPHAHGWPHGSTIAMVAQAPVSGGESTIVMDDDSEVSWMPLSKSGIVINGSIKHGVKKVFGDVPRIGLIATVYRSEND